MHFLIGFAVVIAILWSVTKFVTEFPRFSLSVGALFLLCAVLVFNSQPKYEPIIVPNPGPNPCLSRKCDFVDEFLASPRIIYPSEAEYAEARRRQQELQVQSTADGPTAIKPLPGTARKVY